MKNKKIISKICTVLLPLFAVVFMTPSALAQSTSSVLQTMFERYEQNMEGIENYTVVMEMNGTANTFYYERQMVDGHPVYRLAGSSIAGSNSYSNTASRNTHALLRKAASHAQLKGTENVEGYAAYVVTIDDISSLDLGLEASKHFSIQSITYWIDTEKYIARKMQMKGTTRAGGKDRAMTMNMDIGNYREVEGMLYPFSMVMSIEGMVSGEQQKKMSAAMKKMQKQLEKLPLDQRKRIKKMMESRMGGMMQSMSGGNFNFTARVKDIQVNEGPPEFE